MRLCREAMRLHQLTGCYVRCQAGIYDRFAAAVAEKVKVRCDVYLSCRSLLSCRRLCFV